VPISITPGWAIDPDGAVGFQRRTPDVGRQRHPIACRVETPNGTGQYSLRMRPAHCVFIDDGESSGFTRDRLTLPDISPRDSQRAATFSRFPIPPSELLCRFAPGPGGRDSHRARPERWSSWWQLSPEIDGSSSMGSLQRRDRCTGSVPEDRRDPATAAATTGKTITIFYGKRTGTPRCHSLPEPSWSLRSLECRQLTNFPFLYESAQFESQL